jgi:hypothetical protein
MELVTRTEFLRTLPHPGLQCDASAGRETGAVHADSRRANVRGDSCRIGRGADDYGIRRDASIMKCPITRILKQSFPDDEVRIPPFTGLNPSGALPSDRFGKRGGWE